MGFDHEVCNKYWIFTNTIKHSPTSSVLHLLIHLGPDARFSIIFCLNLPIPFVLKVTGTFELLRPNLKDVLYQVEVNTFRDGLLTHNDHAGCGFMLARCGRTL